MALVILGAGGHARVVAESALANGLSVGGFADDDRTLLGTRPLGLPILGTIAEVASGGIAGDGVLLGIGGNAVRLALARRFNAAGFTLPVLIHPRGWCSPSAMLAAGTVVMANATVQSGCRLGLGVILNTNASIDHDTMLGDGVHVAPGAHLAGNVIVGEGSHIGIGASIIEGIRIGAGCLIAAGAVVVRDVPDAQRVAGVPARPMSRQEQA